MEMPNRGESIPRRAMSRFGRGFDKVRWDKVGWAKVLWVSALVLGLPIVGFGQAPDSTRQPNTSNPPEKSPNDTARVQFALPAKADTTAVSDTSLFFAGEDTARAPTSSGGAFVPNPRAAWKWALIPGAGQLYNRSYWKVPIVYAGLGTLGYFTYRQHVFYVDANDDYQATVTDANPAGNSSLRANRDFYRSNRDLLIIFSTLGYVVQIIEAYVDAHLQPFDVSDDLSWYVAPPAPGPFVLAGYAPQVGLRLHIR